MPEKGFLERQCEAVKKDTATWPRWMKREGGLETDKIFVGFPNCLHPNALSPGAKIPRMIGIIAFNIEEAEKNTIASLANFTHTEPENWEIEDFTQVRDVKENEINTAARILKGAGILMLQISDTYVLNEGKIEVKAHLI